ncbi:MAG: helix-turn-helix transcriptional regulator [Clostridia bacterium]|nr:helix-turn-helix transcriptional regulator [Clostridia bacterium]
MIRLRAKELLEKKGKTKYWLHMQLGTSYQNLSKMLNNQTHMIRYENIEALCRILECTPNDLFELIDDEPEK